jgi:hypothetical protein
LGRQCPHREDFQIDVLTGILLGGCAVDMDERPPQFLLIVRERLRPGSEEAYDKNERQAATVCATLKCPHPYLALATVTGPREVWWLNAFASQEERDSLDASYARNEPLMTAMRPLGKRKEDFRESITSTMTEFRPDLSTSTLRIAGARFLIITAAQDERAAIGAVFQATDGRRFVIASASGRGVAEDLGARMRPGATILAVHPQWSFPDEAWIAADPEFWQSSLVARKPGASGGSL